MTTRNKLDRRAGFKEREQLTNITKESRYRRRVKKRDRKKTRKNLRKIVEAQAERRRSIPFSVDAASVTWSFLQSDTGTWTFIQSDTGAEGISSTDRRPWHKKKVSRLLDARWHRLDDGIDVMMCHQLDITPKLFGTGPGECILVLQFDGSMKDRWDHEPEAWVSDKDYRAIKALRAITIDDAPMLFQAMSPPLRETMKWHGRIFNSDHIQMETRIWAQLSQ